LTFLESGVATDSLLAVLFANRSAAHRELGLASKAQQDARMAVAHSSGTWGKAHVRLYESFLSAEEVGLFLVGFDWASSALESLPVVHLFSYIEQMSSRHVGSSLAKPILYPFMFLL
jgi:hypothetical protein